MNKIQVLAAIRKAGTVEVGVSITQDDVIYLKITKAAALRMVREYPEATFNVLVEDDRLLIG